MLSSVPFGDWGQQVATALDSLAPRRRVALLVVHGIGAQRRDWADAFVTRVRSALARLDANVRIHAAVAWWAPVTQRYEDRLSRRFAGLGWWAWRWLRNLVIAYGGDVVAYQAPSRVWVEPPWIYRAVHERLNRRLQDIVRDIVTGRGTWSEQPVPLVVVAHSLGSVIFSDFVYDLESGVAPPAGFRRHYRLALRALFTIGSPLALYAIRYPHLGFDRPLALDAGGMWINALYRADVLAYPLRVASREYGEAVAEDWILAPRLWPPYWTPLAHLAYWNDGQLIRRVAAELERNARPDGDG